MAVVSSHSAELAISHQVEALRYMANKLFDTVCELDKVIDEKQPDTLALYCNRIHADARTMELMNRVWRSMQDDLACLQLMEKNQQPLEHRPGYPDVVVFTKATEPGSVIPMTPVEAVTPQTPFQPGLKPSEPAPEQEQSKPAGAFGLTPDTLPCCPRFAEDGMHHSESCPRFPDIPF